MLLISSSIQSYEKIRKFLGFLLSSRGSVSTILALFVRPPEKVEPELNSLLSRLHVLVVGPGLGREDYMIKYAKQAIGLARKQQMYLVLDADALWMIGTDVEVIKGYNKAVVTPNVAEFKRLSEQLVSILSDFWA